MKDEPENLITDGNGAVAHVAQATNEVIAIYPITPSSPMGELSDEFSAKGRENIWGTVPTVVEMQSEAGAAGAVHGALTTGALTTTFTASQGLLLMIPNMFKIAGELTPTVFHITARALAVQGLNIFGDHSDIMAARATGWAMLGSSNVQECMDMALVSQAASLESRIPFMHFFDGFRTSHEIAKIKALSYDQMRSMLKPELVHAHRARALDPEKPVIRGTSQDPDVYFASRESSNKYYIATPGIIEDKLREFEKLTGRKYELFEYYGAKDAERIIVIMGSGAETVQETIDYMLSKGEKVGVLKVRLFRPFSPIHMVNALPETVKSIAVMDRTKEPGSIGEPLYEDVRTAIGEVMSEGKAKFKNYPKVVGGRYGLGSAEFNPGMVLAIFDNLKLDQPKNKFTIGIYDDVTNTSIPWDETFSIEKDDVNRALFYGLGSDGTVGANKNSIKIIGESTDLYPQGYFVYNSKKAGTITVSHVRFGPRPIKSAYLIGDANFIACSKYSYVEKVDMLSRSRQGATFLLNSPFPEDRVWQELPKELQKIIIEKDLKFYAINATKIAEECGMGNRTNVIMQVAYFKISGVLPEAQALELIKKAIIKTYAKKGQDVVDANIRTVDVAARSVVTINYPKTIGSTKNMLEWVPSDSPKFVKEVTGEILAGRGDKLPISMLPDDGTFPVGTTKFEKRAIADTIPVWDPATCIQCGDCAAVCPHAVIRMKVYEPDLLAKAPATFKSTETGPILKKDFPGYKFTIQVSPEDCTSCAACFNICPAHKKDANGQKTEEKALAMMPFIPLRKPETENWNFFLNIPYQEREKVKKNTTIGSQILEPLFEFSGACAGCGETPYVKLLSQYFGDRAVIANATGCSSIYGGNLPTTPYTTRKDGKGPAWSNSLFEDAAEFGFGFRLTADQMFKYGNELVVRILANNTSGITSDVLSSIVANKQNNETEIEQMRSTVNRLKKEAIKAGTKEAKELLSMADFLVKKSVWILGGDGWAYDIGFGGLDHVIATDRNVNILVMDTEVYSNTGGQMSKATPTGAIAKFAAGGKALRKKDLGAIAMSYGSCYVATIAMGYQRQQTLKAFMEAEAYPGPSIIIAYSHCIAHGFKDMRYGMDSQEMAVKTGLFPLYRYNPLLSLEGKNPLVIDSKEPVVDALEDHIYGQVRFKQLLTQDKEAAGKYLASLKKDVVDHYRRLKALSDIS